MDVKTMIETQLLARGISDPKVLDAMFHVPRDIFVPQHYKRFAYSDQPLPIGYDQTISQPYVVALMTELLELKGCETVLEIGAGSGYQAAVLSQIVKKVYSVERIKNLAQRAKAILAEFHYDNVQVICADGFEGFEEKAPFDAIILTCAPQTVPDKVLEQLAVGGRMILPVGYLGQQLKIIERHTDKFLIKDSVGVRFVPMLHGID